MMKPLLFLAIVLLIACEQDKHRQTEGGERQFVYSELDDTKFSIKRVEGKIFDENLPSRIEMKRFKSPTMYSKLAISVFHYQNNTWKHSFTDTLFHIYLECDSLAVVDLNNDGRYEWMIQRFEGMGNVTDYYFSVYAMKNNRIVHLDKLSRIANLTFQSKENTCTSFEKGDDVYIGRKYLLDNDLNFTLIEEQHLVESKDQWLKKNYTFKNGQKKLKNQKFDGSLGKEFYGYLQWCK